jgi:hypothetical protein
MKKVERWKVEMPTEQEMLPKDKYTVFDRKVKRYRKGIHSKWFSRFDGVWKSGSEIRESEERRQLGNGLGIWGHGLTILNRGT